MADERATSLANSAIEAFEIDQQDKAARLLREAISLSPNNATVKQGIERLREAANIPPLNKLCLRLVVEQDSVAGKEALGLVKSSTGIIPAEARDCLELLCDNAAEGSSESLQREFFEELLKKVQQRPEVIPEICTDASKREKLFIRVGLGNSLGILAAIISNTSLWRDSDVRLATERDLLSKLSSQIPTVKKDGESSVALAKAISRFVVTDIEGLQHHLGQSVLEFLLGFVPTNGFNDSHADVKAAATIAIAKIFEAKDTAQSMFSKYIWGLIADDDDEDLIKAYETLAAIFPISPTGASTLFLSGDFMDNFIPSLDGRDTGVEKAALDLLSAAASAPAETGCRKAIKEHCAQYLEMVMRSNDEVRSIAATILAKLGYSVEDKPVVDIEELSKTFKDMMVKNEEKSQNESLEGLAYSSLKAVVKEKLVADEKFISNLVQTLKRNTDKPTLVYPALVVVSNLTTYTRPLTDEQKKLATLKNYAAAKKVVEDADPLDSDERVTARCVKLVKAGVVGALTFKNPSDTAKKLIAEIMLSLSRSPANRGLMAQQGAPRQLLTIYHNSKDFHVQTTAAHALSRILISMDPSLVFSSSFPSTSTIRPLVKNLTPPEVDGASDFLPVFESLMALTNLASSPSDQDRQFIIQQAWDRIEDLMLVQNEMVRRAAVELICNLMLSPYCIEKFADGSPSAMNRLNILIVMTDSEDMQTRMAAGGALAQLLEFEPSCESLLKREGGVEMLLRMVDDEQVDMAHRGVACVLGLVYNGGEAAKVALKKANAEARVMATLRKANNPQLLESGVEILKILTAS